MWTPTTAVVGDVAAGATNTWVTVSVQQRTHRVTPSSSMTASIDPGKKPFDDDRMVSSTPPGTRVGWALVVTAFGEKSETPLGSVTTIAGSDCIGPNVSSVRSSSVICEEPLRCDSTHGGWKPSDATVVEVVVATSVV